MAEKRTPSARMLIWIGITAAALFLGVASLRNWQDLSAARQREAAVEAEITATEQRLQELERRIERLRDDPTAVERLAREELGLAKPGEVVVLLPEEREATDGTGSAEEGRSPH